MSLIEKKVTRRQGNPLDVGTPFKHLNSHSIFFLFYNFTRGYYWWLCV